MRADLYGIREAQRKLKAVGGGAQKAIRLVGNEVTGDLITGAQRRAAQYGPAAIAAAATLTARSDQRGARVRLGGKRHPQALGQEFGAAQDRQRYRKGPGRPHYYRGYRQFRPHRGKQGYWLWPEIRQTLPTMARKYETGMKRLMASHGLT